MQLDVTPEALAAASGQVAALTGRLIGANAAHMVANATILPPGSDLASVRTAGSLQASGMAHQAAAAMGRLSRPTPRPAGSNRTGRRPCQP